MTNGIAIKTPDGRIRYVLLKYYDTIKQGNVTTVRLPCKLAKNKARPQYGIII
jgi:hypothetical protein